MRVAIIENTGLSPLSLLGKALDEAGAEQEVFRPHAGDALPQDDAGFDALVVLGGEQSALADRTHPYLPALARLMRRWAEDGRSVLGICLDAQLLARGYGAENHIGTSPEIGWHSVALTEAGRGDPVISAAGDGFCIFEWHNDTFTLPDGTLHLAQNAGNPVQAFRAGRNAYATQFHLEADREVVAEWTRAFPAAAEAMRPGWSGDHPADAARFGQIAEAAGLAIARAWVARI